MKVQSFDGDGTRRSSPAINDEAADDTRPPTYVSLPTYLELHEGDFEAQASLTHDGRVDFNINRKLHWLSDDKFSALQDKTGTRTVLSEDLPPAYLPTYTTGELAQFQPPSMSVVMQVVGSRGDVQTFVAFGKVLKATYGHRVRVATHPEFEQFVKENGLEFFSIGGVSSEFKELVVKNQGLVLGLDSARDGEIGKIRQLISHTLHACWRSCIEPTDDSRLFVADAIIANPPSFAHIHCAEKLGIPLHLIST
jgi:hypothetical protein